jgi:hypothetical protein
MRRIVGPTFFVGLLLVFAGCAPRRAILAPDLPAGFPYHSAAQIAQQVLLTSEPLEAFEARASFVVRSPEQSGRFNAELRNRRGDSLYMSISPGLGIEAARVLVTPDSVYLYDRIHNRLTYGSIDEAGAMLALPITSDAVFRNLLGILAPEPDVPWEVSSSEALYILRDPEGTRLYEVDPSVWRVTMYEERRPDGALVEQRVFSEFDVFEGIILPRRAVFQRPFEQSMASLYYRSIELNPPDLSFSLRVSTSARREHVSHR